MNKKQKISAEVINYCKRSRSKYIWKTSKVKGIKYQQIWEWNVITKQYEYALNVGSAKSAYDKLVKKYKPKN